MKEKWKPVKGMPSFEASSEGRLRRVLEPYKHSSGYLQVKVGFGSQSKNKYVHRLVAQAFHGPCPHGKEVHHVDGDKKNNKPKNLVYVTHKENIGDAIKRGLGAVGKRGKQNHACKLSDADVARMRKLYARGARQIDLAGLFKVSASRVNSIVQGRVRCAC